MPGDSNRSRLSWLSFLFQGNIWISLCAGAWMWVSLQLFDLEQSTDLVLFAFFATLFLYNFQVLVKLRQGSSTKRTGWIQWYERHRAVIIFFCAVGFTGTLACAFRVGWSEFLILAIPGLISVFYVIRFVSLGGKRRSLREIPFLKIWLIGISWVFVCVILPIKISEGYSAFARFDVVLLCIERFLFVVAITIPFDIRDLPFDPHDLKTIPQIVGKNGAQYIGMSMLVACIVIDFFLLFRGDLSMNSVQALVIGNAFSLGLVYVSSPKKHPWYFLGLLDGMMIFQAILLLIAG